MALQRSIVQISIRLHVWHYSLNCVTSLILVRYLWPIAHDLFDRFMFSESISLCVCISGLCLSMPVSVSHLFCRLSIQVLKNRKVQKKIQETDDFQCMSRLNSLFFFGLHKLFFWRDRLLLVSALSVVFFFFFFFLGCFVVWPASRSCVIYQCTYVYIHAMYMYIDDSYIYAIHIFCFLVSVSSVSVFVLSVLCDIEWRNIYKFVAFLWGGAILCCSRSCRLRLYVRSCLYIYVYIYIYMYLYIYIYIYTYI